MSLESVWIQLVPAVSRARRCYLDKGSFQAEAVRCPGWLTLIVGPVRNWKRPEDKASPEAAAGSWPVMLDLALGAGWPHGRVGCALSVPHSKGLHAWFNALFHRREMVHTFWTTDPAFSSCTGSHKLCSRFCLGVKSSSVIYERGSLRKSAGLSETQFLVLWNGEHDPSFNYAVMRIKRDSE